MSGEVLFLAHRVPWPPDRGDKIRSYHMLQHIARLAPVHIATFGETDADMACTAELAKIAQSHCLVRRSKSLIHAGMEALAETRAVALTAFDDRQLRAYVAATLASGQISAIFVFSVQMAQYVPDDFAGRVVMDFVDVDSAKFESYSEAGNPAKRWLYGREARLLRHFEAGVACRANRSIFITQDERSLFLKRNSGGSLPEDRIAVIGNGINTDHFDPDAVEAAASASPKGKRILFTGQMDYPPNIEAVVRFAEAVMPLVRTAHPAATFLIAGRNPTEAVRALEGVAGTSVLGAVDDMRCWLKAADIVVAPLIIARGVQNKVLEAMSMALPVVLSSGAATGIEGADKIHFRVADGIADQAAAVAELFANPAKARAMGLAARQQMRDCQSWDAHLSPLRDLLGLTNVPPVAAVMEKATRDAA